MGKPINNHIPRLFSRIFKHFFMISKEVEHLLVVLASQFLLVSPQVLCLPKNKEKIECNKVQLKFLFGRHDHVHENSAAVSWLLVYAIRTKIQLGFFGDNS